MNVNKTNNNCGLRRLELYSKFKKFVERHGFWLFICSIAILVAVVFRDYILQRKLYLFSDNGQDSLVVFYPKWLEVCRYLREWGIPTWSFQTGMGQNIFPGNINDPFSLLLYLSGQHYLAQMIIYVELLKFFSVGVIFYFYLRTIGLKKYASSIGGLMMTFSGYMIVGSSGWYGHSALVVYGVFWLLAFEQLYVKKNILLFPLAVVLLSTSSVFYVYIFTIFLFAYALTRFVCGRTCAITESSDNAKLTPSLSSMNSGIETSSQISTSLQRIHLRKSVYGFITLMLKLAGLGALGLAMNAIFIINPLMTMLGSPRVGGDASYSSKLLSHQVFGLPDPLEYLTTLSRLFSVDILGTAEKYFQGDQFIQSYHGWGNHFEAPLFYCSLPALLLIPQLFTFINKRKKIILAIFFLFLGIFLIFPYFRYALYLFSGNYYKGGLNFFIPAFMVWGATWAMNEIDSRGVKPKLLLCTLLSLLFLLYIPFFSPIKATVDKTMLLTVTILLPIYVITLLMMNKPKTRAVGKTAFFILLLFELGWGANITVNHRNAVTTEEFKSKQGYNDYTIEAVAYIKSIDKGFYRIQKEYVGKPAVYINMNDSQLQNFYGTPSYNSFNQKNYIAFLAGADLLDPTKEWQTRCSRGVSGSPVMQSFASVKYWLAKGRRKDFERYGYKLIHKTGDVWIYKNPYALPFGFTNDKYMTENEYSKLDSRQKSFAMLKLFTVSNVEKKTVDSMLRLRRSDIPKRYKSSDYANNVKLLSENHLNITSFTPKRITGTITLPEKRMMILTTPFDKGWTAALDGENIPIHIVDYGLMGVIIPEGTHSFEFRFRLSYLISTGLISALALFVYLLSCGFSSKLSRLYHEKTIFKILKLKTTKINH